MGYDIFCLELNFCIIMLYDTLYFFLAKKQGRGGEEGVSQIYSLV